EIKESFQGLYKIYAQQWGLSVKALWYYRMYEYEKAINLTKKYSDLIDILIENGMYSLIFRNIEQNKNLSFIEQKKNNIKKSQEITKDIIIYLLVGKKGKLYGDSFNIKIWKEMPYLRNCFAYTNFRDQAHTLLILLKRKEREKSERLFNNIFFST